MKVGSLFRPGRRLEEVTGTDLLLNLGCGGTFHPDWVNVDVVPQRAGVYRHDLHEPIPLRDGCCAAVYHSHVLEHFSREMARGFLRECWRLLKSGGVLRVVVPDLEIIARLYLENLEGALGGDAAAADRYEWMVLELLDQMVRDRTGGQMMQYWARNPMPAEEFVIQRCGWEALHTIRALRKARREAERAGRKAKPEAHRAQTPSQIARFRNSGEVHKWMYDRYSLAVLLRGTGFTQPTTCSAYESRIPHFNSYHLDATAEGAVRKPDSLFMEAIKP